MSATLKEKMVIFLFFLTVLLLDVLPVFHSMTLLPLYVGTKTYFQDEGTEGGSGFLLFISSTGSTNMWESAGATPMGTAMGESYPASVRWCTHLKWNGHTQQTTREQEHELLNRHVTVFS